MPVRRSVRVEVRATIAPDGRPGVLVQLDDAWFVLPPEGAAEFAALVVDAIAECFVMGGDGDSGAGGVPR